jgi:hypothetical protein
LSEPICPICLSPELKVLAQRYVERGAKSPNDEPLREQGVTIEYRCTRCGHTFDHVGRAKG